MVCKLFIKISQEGAVLLPGAPIKCLCLCFGFNPILTGSSMTPVAIFENQDLSLTLRLDLNLPLKSGSQGRQVIQLNKEMQNVTEDTCPWAFVQVLQ